MHIVPQGVGRQCRGSGRPRVFRGMPVSCPTIMHSGQRHKTSGIAACAAEAYHAFTVHQKNYKKTMETLVTIKVSIVLPLILKLWRYRKG